MQVVWKNIEKNKKESGTMETQMLVAILIASIVGLIAGYAVRSLFSRWQSDAMEKQAKAKLDEADEEAARRLREADIKARTELVQSREAFAETTRERQAALQEYDERIAAREGDIERKMHVIEEKERQLNATKEEQRETARALDMREDTVAAQEREAVRQLQKIAGMTAEEAREALRNKVKDQVKAECGAYFRRRYEEAKTYADRKAAELVSYAVRRYAAAHASESMTSLVPIPTAEIKGRIIGRDGRNVRSIEAATGVTLIVDGTTDAVVVSCFNPVRREIARRALLELVDDGRIHPASIESAVEKVTQDFNDELVKEGRDAAAQFGLDGVSSEILRGLGRLKYRLSYSQNVLAHSIEVARLMGSMADELKLDGALARRIGLFHDIGKGMTDEKEGAHAKLGADLLASQGEDPILVNAVAAHHEEVEQTSVYAVLCSAADAISSARPGARSESSELYFERIGKLEEIATSHAGVKSAFAMRAGHELRIVVDSEQVSDNDAMIMAHDIASEVEGTLRYPGQIRVVVIREKRCIEYAR